VSGSLKLEEQIRQLMPDVHVFGHTHIPFDMTLDGVRYVQWALGTPREQRGQTRVVFAPLCLYDTGEQTPEVPQLWTHWGQHYQAYERDLSRTELAPWAASHPKHREFAKHFTASFKGSTKTLTNTVS